MKEAKDAGDEIFAKPHFAYSSHEREKPQYEKCDDFCARIEAFSYIIYSSHSQSHILHTQ